MNKLTDKQKIFCDEYLVDLNATRAYKVAYPKVKRDETVNAAASRMLRNVKVAEYIEQRMKDREKRTEITQDMVLQELVKVAMANGTDFARVVKRNTVKIGYDERGNEIRRAYDHLDVEVIDTDSLSADKKAAIAGIKQGANGIEVKLNDKVKALELIGRHLGMFKDKIELSGQVNNPVKGLTTEELKKALGLI